MLISAKIIPNAPREGILLLPDGSLKIKVQAVAQDGKANKAAIALIAKYYHVPKNCVKIISGEKSRYKIIEVFCLQNEAKSDK